MARTPKSSSNDNAAASDQMLGAIVKAMQKSTGRGEVDIGIMGDGLFRAEPREWISSRVRLLDTALEGGIPVGRIVEIFGEPSTGKTLLLLTILASAQQEQDALCCYIESELGVTRQFAEQLAHVDPKRIAMVDVETLEDGCRAASDFLHHAQQLIKSRGTDRPIVIALDSIAMFPTEAERDAMMDESVRLAEAARVIRRWMRTIRRDLAHSRATLIFTNHETSKIGGFGEAFTTYGGTGGKFGASLRLRLQLLSRLRDGDRPLGIKVRIHVYKTRFSAPWRQLDVPLFFDRGFDDAATTVLYLQKTHALGEKPGWYIWEGKSYRRTELIARMRDEPEFGEAVTKRAIEVYLAGGTGTEESPADPADDAVA